MPYYRDIPGSNQRMSQSQPQLLDNTNDVEDAFNRDHIHIAGTFEGKHADMHFFPLPEDPAPNTFHTEIEMFNFKRADTSDALQEICIRRGVSAIHHMATARIGGFAQSPALAFNWTQLPSGVIIKAGWNFANSVSAVDINLNEGVGTPVYTAIPFAYCTVCADVPLGHDIYVLGIAINNLAVRIGSIPGSQTTKFNWFTIGI